MDQPHPAHRPSEAEYAALQKPLEHFRANTKRLQIHPLEITVLAIVGLHVTLLPWALGGMRLWAQIPSLILAVLGFVVAMIPRNYTEDHTGSNRFRLIIWPKLVRFPLFWIGLAFLGYIVAQALNPAWTYRTDGKGWWMLAIAYKEWLPSGVEAPIERWGPWRLLLVYSSVWLTICTMWVAFTRRRTIQIFLTWIAANGFALAVFGIAQRLLSNGKMYWSWESPNASFFSTFIYKNHAGAFLDLGLAVSCGIAGWYYLRGLRRLEKSNPAGLFAFLTTCTAVAVLVSYARGATLVMLIFLLATVIGFVIHQMAVPEVDRKPIVAVVLIILFGYFLKTGLEALQSQIAWNRLRQGVMQEDTSIAIRRVATKATGEMFRDNWKYGVGAGSFRFLFPVYQHRYPELLSVEGARLYWEHAHNDIVEFSAEMGIPGLLLGLLALGFIALQLIRNFFWQNPLSVCVVLGLVLVAAYSWWDFPFQCPAVLLLWWVLAVAAMMWTQLEELNLKG